MKSMYLTCTLHGEHMFKFQVNILKNVEVVRITRFCWIVLPSKKSWTDPHKKIYSANLLTNICLKFQVHYLENCKSSLRHKILLNNAPLQRIMDWSIKKYMSRTWALYAEHMISVSSRYLENCRSLHNTIVFNHVPYKKIMDWSTRKICHAHLHFMPNICL
jgi:hypothetical protein